MDKARDTTCFICSRPGSDSRDHIVPTSLFAGTLPQNLVTLPAHHACHAHLGEEYVRDLLALIHITTNPVAYELSKGKIRRSIDRNPPLRHAIAETLRSDVDVLSHGGVWLGKSPGIEFDRGRVYPVLEKIVKGLYRHHLGRFMPCRADTGWHIFLVAPQGDILDLLKASHAGLSYPPVFESKYIEFPQNGSDDEDMSVWWMLFYNSLMMYCVVM